MQNIHKRITPKIEATMRANKLNKSIPPLQKKSGRTLSHMIQSSDKKKL